LHGEITRGAADQYLVVCKRFTNRQSSDVCDLRWIVRVVVNP
jgi:hypothetical protein